MTIEKGKKNAVLSLKEKIKVTHMHVCVCVHVCVSVCVCVWVCVCECNLWVCVWRPLQKCTTTHNFHSHRQCKKVKPFFFKLSELIFIFDDRFNGSRPWNKMVNDIWLTSSKKLGIKQVCLKTFMIQEAIL